MRINPRLKNDLKKFLIDKIKNDKKQVRVVSSYSLESKEKNILKKKFPSLEWKEAKYIIDKSIIAGVIIYAGSQIIDLSLKGSLSNLQKTIYESD